MMTATPLIPVILAEELAHGSAASRASYPKQYWPLSGEGAETPLQQTQQRLTGLEALEPPLLICTKTIASSWPNRCVRSESSQTRFFWSRWGATPHQLWWQRWNPLQWRGPRQVLAADHLIRDAAQFRQAINAGRKPAEEGRLVTFGIVPTAPETGYGYIEASEPFSLGEPAHVPIKRFVEKPDQATAEKFLATGRFTWNSGMFLFRASAMLAELERLTPEVVSCCRAALEQDLVDMEFHRLEREAFAKCPNVAIDVAVMEQTELGSVLPLDAGWSDVGSWNALWETSEQRDSQGNVLQGHVIAKDSRRCYIRSEHRLVVGLGVENLVVVETDDAVLIADRSKGQEIKGVVKQLEAAGSPEGKAHRKIYRPWGHYTGVTEGTRWQVKRISVKPGASLSLQMHHHRAEHWVVVKGTAWWSATATKSWWEKTRAPTFRGLQTPPLQPRPDPVELIEVQSGEYLGEDDIVRFDDVYGRNDLKAISL